MKPKFQLPTHIGKVPVKGATKIALAEAKKKEQPIQEQTQPVTNAPKKQGMIYIPSIDLYFNKQRTHLNKNWNKTHELLKQEEMFMPTPYQFKEFLKYLRNNPSTENTEIYNEITQVKNPWRSNWLNARFEKRKNKLYMISENIQENQTYKTIEQELKDILMKDKTPGISLDDWINNSNKQGLPKSTISSGNLYYWHPRKDYVARFYANSDRANLICSRHPENAYSSLGVFGCCEGAR